MKITNRVIEAFLDCRYKAYLFLKGETGSPHDYEVLRNELQLDYKPKATEALLRRLKIDSAPTIPTVRIDDLKKRYPLILDCTVEYDKYQFNFDALMQVNGESSLTPIHWVPIMFLHENSLREQHKLLLACGSFVLGKIQDRSPRLGNIVFGQQCRLSRTRVVRRKTKVEVLLDDLRQITDGTVART